MLNTPNTDLLVQAGLQLPNEKKFYANGFSIAISAADVILILLLNNQPIATVNITHSVAKSIVETLGVILKQFEKKTRSKITTLNIIAEKMNITEGNNAQPK
jgi:hypothetical protein